MSRFLPRVDARTQSNLLVSFAVAQWLGLVLVCLIAVGTWDAGKLRILLDGDYQGKVAILTCLLWYLAESGRTD